MKNLQYILIAIGLLIISACGLKSVLDKPDNAVEEIAEGIVEDIIEETLDLPDGALDGKIDFTPSSDEGD